jgi:protein suppressor of PHYA-105 1
MVELTLKNCINTGIQPEVSAGGSTSSRDRPTRIKGLWGNFTRIAGELAIWPAGKTPH